MKPVSKAQYDKIRKIPDTPAGHKQIFDELVKTNGKFYKAVSVIPDKKTKGLRVREFYGKNAKRVEKSDEPYDLEAANNQWITEPDNNGKFQVIKTVKADSVAFFQCGKIVLINEVNYKQVMKIKNKDN